MGEIINHAVLSLDFCQDTVTYERCAMPTGAIGYAVINQLIQGLNISFVDMELLQAKSSPLCRQRRLSPVWIKVYIGEKL